MDGAIGIPRPAKRLHVFNEFEQALEPLPGHAGSGSSQADEAAEALGCPQAQAWLTCLARHCESAEGAKSKAGLTELLQCGARSRSQVVAVQNRVRQEIGKIYSWTHRRDGPGGADDPQRARQCQYLFERVLHGMLRQALGAEEGGSEGAGPAGGDRLACVERVLEDEQLQLGLVHAAVETVNFAYLRDSQQTFPWAALALGRMHYTLELWQAIDWLVDQLETPLQDAGGNVPGIPESVVAYLLAIQVRVEEELAYINSSSLYRRIVLGAAALKSEAGGADARLADGGTGSQRSPRPATRPSSRYTEGGAADAALLARFLSSMARTAMLRMSSVCRQVLAAHPRVADTCPELPSRACLMLDLVLCRHLDLLFGRHLSVCMACAIYLTVRLHGEALPFRKITALMAEVLEQHEEATFAAVELPPEEGAAWDSEPGSGDTRAFYNRAFLPALSAYDAERLFGKGLPPTPSKQLLEAPEPAAAPPDEPQPAAPKPAGAADGQRGLRRLRRPLGQVSANSVAAGAGASGGTLARVR